MKYQMLGASYNSETWSETWIRVLHEHATCGLHVQYQLQDVASCPKNVNVISKKLLLFEKLLQNNPKLLLHNFTIIIIVVT